jgi:16S rRNA (guanine1207-N2)-methyltransferase
VVAVASHYFSSEPGSRLEKGIIETYLRGRRYRFLTATGVFSHKRIDNGTRLLVESMWLPSEGGLLDMGCGIGVIGIVAAVTEPGLRVTLTDVNSRATMLAGENVRRMGLGNVEVLTGDLYGPVGGRVFSTIVSNPPISAGMRKVVEPLVSGAVDHLEVGGLLQLVVQSNTGGRTLAGFLDRYFGGHEVVSRGSGYRVLSARRQ